MAVLSGEEVKRNIQNPSFDLEGEINKLKHEKSAIILAHYYQDSEIQDIADFIGDSLQLSQQSLTSDSEVIVFAGVTFMAEVANILNDKARIYVPDMGAGCSLEDSCPPDKFGEFLKRHPDHAVVSYINCSAEVKALSDIICTSSNAGKVVGSIPESKPVIFAPDRHLGSYVQKTTGREMLLWDGSCIVHERFSEEELVKLKVRHPQAITIAHPECPETILSYADIIGSTSRLLSSVSENSGKDFIVLTEPGIIHQMKRLGGGDSNFYTVPFFTPQGSCASCNNCPFMKLNTMEKIYYALATEDSSLRIEVPEPTKTRARASLTAMLDIGRSGK